MLARWLRLELHTIGGEALVRRFGARAVLDALYDGVVCEEPVMEARPIVTGRWPNGDDKVSYRTVEVGRCRVPDPRLRNPGGFLRFLLEEGAGEIA